MCEGQNCPKSLCKKCILISEFVREAPLAQSDDLRLYCMTEEEHQADRDTDIPTPLATRGIMIFRRTNYKLWDSAWHKIKCSSKAGQVCANVLEVGAHLARLSYCCLMVPSEPQPPTQSIPLTQQTFQRWWSVQAVQAVLYSLQEPITNSQPRPQGRFSPPQLVFFPPPPQTLEDNDTLLCSTMVHVSAPSFWSSPLDLHNCLRASYKPSRDTKTLGLIMSSIRVMQRRHKHNGVSALSAQHMYQAALPATAPFIRQNGISMSPASQAAQSCCTDTVPLSR